MGAVGKICYNNGLINKYFCEGDVIPQDFVKGKIVTDKMKGHKMSDEQRQKISQRMKGKPAHNKGKTNPIKVHNYTNGVVNIHIKEGSPIPEGFYPGQIRKQLTDEQKQQATLKRKATCFERYGNETYNNLIQQQQTCMEKYGFTTYSQTQQSKNQTQQTFLEKYDVTNPMQLDEIKEKQRNTLLNKYGVDNISKLYSNKEKIRNAWANKTPDEIEQIKTIRNQTMLELYGVESSCVIPKSYKQLQNSKPNQIFADLLTANNIDYSQELRVGNKWFDFRVNNILIEVNPFATHNSTYLPFDKQSHGLNPNYHKEKSQLAIDNKFRCIHIWDWDDKLKIVKSLNPHKTIYHARKLTLVEIHNKSFVDCFMNDYHFQGTCKGQKVCYGLLYDNQMIQIMTFGKPRYNKNYEWELLRLCTNPDYIVVGGAEKLFTHFVRQYNPSSIISYCDNSKFTGEVYHRLGMTLQSEGHPTRHWYHPVYNLHYTDNLIRQQGFDRLCGDIFGTFGKDTSNDDLLLTYGFVEIYDCGQSVFTYTM